jgi:hypothetical protein
MAATRSGSDIGEAAGGSRQVITQRINYELPMSANLSNDAPEVERSLDALLRLAVQRMARELTDVLPRDVRGDADSYFLADCLKGKRAPSDATLGRLMRIQARADAHERHIVSNALREVEGRLAPATAICVFEASLAEQEANAELDHAQLRAHQEKSPTYWAAVLEKCRIQIERTIRLADAVCHRLQRAA